MFAGPNGSGKSTIKSVIGESLLGYYLNPDDIQREVKRADYFDLRGFDIRTSREEIVTFFVQHPLIERADEYDVVHDIRFIENEFIDFSNVGFNAYLSAILTDFLRHKFIETGKSFSFETVMSSADKLDTLQLAKDLGFRNYLYYVATEDPVINLSRVQHRVRSGGHTVPDDKVVERYYRSLDLLLDAIRLTNRAYIFDNSGEDKVWIAEITDGIDLEIQTDKVPMWFEKYVLDKL